jgi:hypothetical protein
MFKLATYFSLYTLTGKVVARQNWTKLPMSNEVIGRVNVMGRGVPSQAVFKDLRGNVIGNDVPAFNDDKNIPQDAAGHPDDKLPGVMVPKTEESAKILSLGVDTAQESLPELTVYVGNDLNDTPHGGTNTYYYTSAGKR